MKFLRTFLAALSLCLLAAGAGSAHAATAAECSTGAQVRKLSALQKNPPADEMEAIRAELAVRKDILKTAVRCTKRDIEATAEGVRALSVPQEGDKQLQERIAGLVSDVLRDRSLDEARVNDLGLRATKDAAKALKDLRSRTYEPLKERAESFALWIKSYALIATAEIRLRDITGTLESLGIADAEEIAPQLRDAQKNLDDAREFRDAVRPLFEQSADIEELSLALKAEFDALSASYENFFAISGEVKKVVPL